MRRVPEDPMIRELVSRARASVVARRTVLAGAAAAGASIALAACSTGTTTTAAQVGKDHSSSVKNLEWESWPRFIDSAGGTITADGTTLAGFARLDGVSVGYHPTIEGNDAYYATVKAKLAMAQGIGADAVTLTDWMADRWAGLGYAQKLDPAVLTNLGNISGVSKNSTYDTDHAYSVPWNSGFTGLAWNAEAVPRGLGDVIDLWRPELKGKVGVLSDMRDTIGLIMLSLGTDISSDSWGDTEFGQAIGELQKYVSDGQIRSIKGSDYLDDLRSGTTIATMAWSGDIARLNAEVGGQKFIFGLPGSGGALWTTSSVVPVASQEKTNVEKLLNYYLEPEVAARVAAYTNFIPPVGGVEEAMKKIAPGLVGNQNIFPSTDTLSTVKRFRALTAAEQSKYLVQFQGVLLSA